ncbi:PRC-barrel domain-containing protein [Spirulina sp. CS-785/01]|uniref:PRC-barrel domain-containing protein n=1 Tax=Spirulina sp. CS-785/01 TaxID=3021716 RepID=UPI00232DA07D|nr:PRC-barrel domain-containing protein [Spirulina sp. CS-785/01]MDB9313681.1 PRC-barrel domain-containing protein [Spirulina sp. CS-785/01]
MTVDTTTPNLVLQSQFHDKLILDRQTTEKLGYVDQFWIDPRSHQVQGMISKSGFFNRSKQYFPWSNLVTLGKDSVLVTESETSAEPPKKAEIILGHEMWTDTGTKAGRITDFLFNVETGEIATYLFINEGWKNTMLGATYLLQPVAISSVGEKRIIVFETAVEKARKYQEGMGNRWGDFLQEDYEKTREDVQSIFNKTQKAATKLRDVWPQKKGETKDEQGKEN